MDNYLRSIRAYGVFGRLDFNLHFNPDINVIHAENGAGKTTLLHILANALNGDLGRFAYLTFGSIDISFADRQVINIWKARDKDETLLHARINGDAVISGIPISGIVRSRRPAKTLDTLEEWFAEQDKNMPDNDLVGELSFPPILRGSYFPAFRTMIEAWANTTNEEKYRRQTMPESALRIEDELRLKGLSRVGARFQAISTVEARRAFGEFLPVINYPSPVEIVRTLEEETQRALSMIGMKDRELLSQVFIDVFKALSDSSSMDSRPSDPESILEEIRRLLNEDQQHDLTKILETGGLAQTDAYSQLRHAVASLHLDKSVEISAPILNVYRNSLRERSQTQKDVFKQLELYLASINDFLNEKSIIIDNRGGRRPPTVGVRFADRTVRRGLGALSSGERQIVTLIYAATQMSTESVVLIDEPEISLHIDWQRILLKKMQEQIGNRQIIVCTHSPSIGANYLDKMIELEPKYTTKTKPTDFDDLIDDTSSY